jgi:hypothetical protein
LPQLVDIIETAHPVNPVVLAKSTTTDHAITRS